MAVIGSANVIRTAIASFATIAALMVSGAAHASSGVSVAGDVVPPQKVTLDVQSVNGSGCIGGTAKVTMSPDNTGFHISYKEFIVGDGGAAVTTSRKNCQVNVVVHIPQGFTLALASADYRGRLSLSGDATALERTNYYLQGDVDNNYVDHYFSGPASGSWHTIDATPVTALVWAACGRDVSLNVNTQLQVHSSSPSTISLRSSDGDVDTLVQFGWKTC